MGTINDGGPAYPVMDCSQNTASGDTITHQMYGGLSLRDYFAAHAPAMPPALREIAKAMEKTEGRDTSDYGAFAKFESDWRYAYADAMLKARGQ